MAVSVLAYNTLDGFGQPETSEQLVHFVEQQAPNIGFFSEAFAEEDEDNGTLHEAVLALEGLGYSVLYSTYDDTDGRLDRHGFMAISNLPEVFAEKRRFDTRNGVHMLATDPATDQKFDLYGLHADDRTKEGRLRQFRAIPPIVRPTLFVGDHNQEHPDSPRAAWLRRAEPLTKLIPAAHPREEKWKIQELGSLMQRAAAMGRTEPMRHLEGLGLIDADPRHQPTMRLGKKALLQIDRMMHTPDIAVPDGVTVHDEADLSDHYGITATFAIR
jgi:hypothetical protein